MSFIATHCIGLLLNNILENNTAVVIGIRCNPTHQILIISCKHHEFISRYRFYWVPFK
jgi:hypothetical protein